MKQLTIRNLAELPFATSEALNQFRVNLGFCGSDVRVIMLTSSVPNEGKSFLTFQLWRMLADLGNSVILIDCDLRNSELRTKYGVSCSDKITGLAHYLSGQVELDDAIYQTNVANGYMVPVTGAISNPTILLESDRFSALVEKCRIMFDYVLFDTPPIGSVADALNIARECDGMVLVVRSASTPRKVVENSVQLLNRTEKPLLGIVLNRFDVKGKSNLYYKRYYSSNSYYYNNGTKISKKRK